MWGLLILRQTYILGSALSRDPDVSRKPPATQGKTAIGF